MVLTERQAYLAMLRLLEEYYDRTHYAELGALLGQMQLLSDGKSADPALWNDFVRCAYVVSSESPSV